LAVRLTLQSDEATLTDAQIDTAMASILTQLTQQVAARLRG
jgi:phenylalanyl-tRNA synthetase beta chain